MCVKETLTGLIIIDPDVLYKLQVSKENASKQALIYRCKSSNNMIK